MTAGLVMDAEQAESDREEFKTRRFYLMGEPQLMRVLACLRHVPLDQARPLEVVIQERDETRGNNANALMWAGPLKDISRQAWMMVDGVSRRYREEIWHEYFKREYLPEQYTPGITRKGYVKWALDPAGNRVLVGSTTQLTKKGFAEYLTQIEAHGANLGVEFHINPNEIPAMLPR
jgi:hypothetical protein